MVQFLVELRLDDCKTTEPEAEHVQRSDPKTTKYLKITEHEEQTKPNRKLACKFSKTRTVRL